MNEANTEAAEQLVEAEVVEPDVRPEVAPDPQSLGLELPTDPADAVDLLLRELETARSEADSYLDDLKRVAADFDNYRKRTRAEAEATLDRATEHVVVKLMPVLDSFDAALTGEPETESEKNMHSGMLNTRNQLLDALKGDGLEVIPAIGEAFDPEVHEPVSSPEGEGDLVVSQELRRGYRLNGKVLRAALVVLELN